MHLSVTVDDEHLPAIEDVARQLRAHGMQVEQVLDGLGIITGSAGPEVSQALRSVAGVSSVEAQLIHQLPPPDSPIQ